MAENKKIKKAVILAGGLGTRFLPATLAIAKELFPISEKPILMYQLEDLASAGFTDILIVGNHLKESSFLSFIHPPKNYIEKVKMENKMMYLDDYNKLISKLENVSYVNQEIGSEFFNKHNGDNGEKLGSSIAILACKDWANGEPFMAINGDDYCVYDDGKSPSKELVDLFDKTGDYVVYGRACNKSEIYKYSSMVIGKKLYDGAFKMDDIIEKPKVEEAPSNIMGFAKYIFNSDVFDEILRSKPRTNGEYCITDIISDKAKKGLVSTCIFNGTYFDCGSKIGLQMAGNYVLLRDKQFKDALIQEFENMKNKLK